MSKKDYELLGVAETAGDDEIRARYEELKQKYSEDRFLEGEAGNDAARMLNRIEVAYNAIMTERAESRSTLGGGASFAKAEEYIRSGNLNGAQDVLDTFNERPAEWHYLQSVIFYKKSWINESKKQLEIAIQMDPSNEKYRIAYNKLKDKIDFDKKKAETPQNGYNTAQGQGADPNTDYDQQQMGGGGFCEQCATCCACNMLFNCCLNSCCGCR